MNSRKHSRVWFIKFLAAYRHELAGKWISRRSLARTCKEIEAEDLVVNP